MCQKLFLLIAYNGFNHFFYIYHVADFGAFHDPLIPPVTSVCLQCRIFVGDMDFVSYISESQIGASMFCDSDSFDKKHI